MLDDHVVAVRDDLAHRLGCQPDAILEDLDFLRDADAHARCPSPSQTRPDYAGRSGIGRASGAAGVVSGAQGEMLASTAQRLDAADHATVAPTCAHAAASVAMPGSIRAASIDANPTRA